jgi:hypothetical protein
LSPTIFAIVKSAASIGTVHITILLSNETIDLRYASVDANIVVADNQLDIPKKSELNEHDEM